MFYHDVTSMLLMTVEIFRDENIVSGAYIDDCGSYSEFAERASEYFTRYSYLRVESIYTRNDGEAQYGYDDGRGFDENPIILDPIEVTPGQNPPGGELDPVVVPPGNSGGSGGGTSDGSNASTGGGSGNKGQGENDIEMNYGQTDNDTNGSKPYTLNSKDKFWNDKLPDQQYLVQTFSKTCTPTAMAIINNFYGGLYTEQTFAEHSYAQYKTDYAQGMVTETIKKMVNDFFYSYSIDASQGNKAQEWKKAIDSGYPILTHIDGHSIVGIGYTTNNELIYICPYKGELRSVSMEPWNVGWNYNHVITGNKTF